MLWDPYMEELVRKHWRQIKLERIEMSRIVLDMRISSVGLGGGS